MSRTTFLLALLCMMVSSPIATSEMLTEEDAVRLALARNPSVLAAKQGVNASSAGVWQSISAMLPSANAGYTKMRNNEEITMEFPNPGAAYDSLAPPTIEAVVQPLTTGSYTLEVSQPLFTGGALYQSLQISRDSKSVAELELQATRNQVVLEAREAYYGLIKARGLARLAAETRTMLREDLRMVRRMRELGMIAITDVLGVEVAEAGAEQGLQQAEAGECLALASLNLVIDRDIETPVEPVEPPIDNRLHRPMPVDSCIALALRERPDLAAARRGVKIARRGVKAAAGSLLPSAAVTYQYTRNQEESAFSPSRDSWRIIGSVGWELPLGFGNVARVQEAKAHARQAAHAIRAFEKGVSLEVKATHLAVETAQKAIKVAHRRVRAASENHRAISTRYREGDATNLELLDAHQQRGDAITNQLNTSLDLRLAMARLKFAMGLSPEE